MKKTLIIVFMIAILLFAFAGCRSSEEIPPETKVPTESTLPPATESDETDTKPTPAETTEPNATDPNPSDPVATNPKPTDPKPTSPSEPKETEGNKAEAEIIAGGKWDGGPVTWKVTKDGVLTISGNRSVQSSHNYTWKDYANAITRVVVEDGITNVPADAFSRMTKITSVYLGNSVETIDHYAFYGCTGLTSVTISQSVKVIDQYAFAACSNLATVSFASGCRIERINSYAFTESGIRKFTAPSSLRTIKANAFINCERLEYVCLANGISTLEAKAFQGCTGLKTVILGESLTDVGGYVFNGCNAITTLENYTSAYGEFPNLPRLTTLVIGGTRRSTGNYSNCPSLSGVTIHSSVSEISNSAFYNCSALSSITVPESVTTIGVNAFRGTGLTKVRIPASVSSIGMSAFMDCPLNEIVFTGNVPTFQNKSAFTNVNATVYYPATNPTWPTEVQQNYGGTLTWVAN